jgi:hypothetical protein
MLKVNVNVCDKKGLLNVFYGSQMVFSLVLGTHGG